MTTSSLCQCGRRSEICRDRLAESRERGIEGKPKMKPSIRETECREQEELGEKPKIKPSLRETFPCGQKLVLSQSQRVQRDEKDTTFYQNHETLFKTTFFNLRGALRNFFSQTWDFVPMRGGRGLAQSQLVIKIDQVSPKIFSNGSPYWKMQCKL